MDHLAANGASSRGGAQSSGDSVARRVLELASSSFRTPVTELSLDSESETTAGWNSLAHMDFLVSIEASFGLKIAPADMLSIVTLGDAVEHVTEALAQRQAQLQ